MPKKKKKSHPSYKNINLAGKIAEREGKKFLSFNAPQLLSWFLQTHAKVGDEISMNLKVKRPTRTESQNNYFHVYLDLISLSSGHTMEELKSWVNLEVLGKGITEVFGTDVRIVGHTSDLTIPEFVEMMNRVQDLTEIPLPDPEPFNLPLTFDEYHHLVEEERKTYSKMKPKDFINNSQ